MAKHAKTTEGRGSSVPEGVFIVIPAYKEEQSIGTVVRDLHAHGYANVIVVDDGSPDNTSAVAEKAGAIVVRHVINRGQGVALKTGIDYALDQGAEYIVTFDADGQHCPEDIPALLKHVVAGEADVALGSRFIDSSTSNVPLIRRLFLKGGTVLVWAMYGIRLTDVHNGLRVLSRSAAETIELRADKMEHASEILEQIAKHRLRYVEIPVTIRYTEYSIKNTKQGSLPALRIAFRMFLNKFLR